MQIAVCEDNAVERDALCNLLTDYFEKRQVQPRILEFSSGEEAVGSGESFDMAFLDVELGEMNGIQTGKKLQEKNSNIVLFIVTAYDKYLDNAFDLRAFRFLQKPFSGERLFESLDRAMERNYTMAFDVDDHAIVINIYDIVCVYAENGKTTLVSRSRTYHTKYTLNFWKEKLYYDIFAQPHNSYIVNLKYVVTISRDSVVLRFGENQMMKTYISQRKYYDFRRSFFRVLEGRK